MRSHVVDGGLLQVEDQCLRADRLQVCHMIRIADEARDGVASLGEQSFENQGDLAVPAGDDDAHQAANTCESSANAVNSNAFPAGSSRNIVHCSPVSPSKRTYGSMTKSTSAARSRSTSLWK